MRSAWEEFNATKRVNIHVLAADVVLVEPEDVLGHDDVGDSVQHRGREAYVRSLRKLTDTWDDFRIEPEELFDLGDRLVVFVRWRGRGHASGIPLDQPLAYVGILRDGQLARTEVYAQRHEALEAVGLSE